MSQLFGDLKLIEGFPSSSLLKLAENRFKEGPFTCRQLYDAHIDYYGKEHRKLKHVASSIANLMHSNQITRIEEKTADNLTQYRLTGNKLDGKEMRFSKNEILNVIKEKYRTKEFTSADISSHFENRDISFHIRSLKKEGSVEAVGRSSQGLLYRYVIDLGTDCEEQQPIEIQKNQTINKEILQSLDIPIELIGESIVMNISTLKRKIDHLEMVENSWKRQVDELNKTVKSQSRIIENLNAKISQLNSETHHKSKDSFAKLGEIAKISVLKNPRNG